MKTVSAAQLAAHLGKYLDASRAQPVLVTRKGKPVAVLLAVQNKAEAEQLALDRLRSLRSSFQEAHEQLQEGKGIPHDQFWREVEQARQDKQQASAPDKKAPRRRGSELRPRSQVQPGP